MGTLSHKQNSFENKTIDCLWLLHNSKNFLEKKAAKAALKKY
jgi:hypothetical protein